MSCRIFCRLLLSTAIVAAPALADSIERDHRGTVRAGDMEHIEVIGRSYAPDASADNGEQERGLKQILKQQLLEQVQSLKLLQRRLLEKSHARNREALATEQRRRETSQDSARAEALRREQERADELRRREEERLRTEAEAREQQEPS